MARKPRIHYQGAFYHVILRGNGKQDVFFDDKDRCRFYLLLQEGVERFRIRIHAFCLMTNHIHLVLQVHDLPLPRFMQNLSLRYTRWVNWRHNRTGHLFQGRYKAVLVDGDSYLLELVRYVHLNPVRAGFTKSPVDFRWSGHGAYCGKETIPWLCSEMTLGMLSGKKSKAIRAYEAFVRDGLGEGRKAEFHGEGTGDSRIFGDDDFVLKLAYEGKKMSDMVTVDNVISAVCCRYGLKPDMLALPGKNRALSHARGMAAWIVQDLTSCSLTELGRRTGRDISTLSAIAARLQARTAFETGLLREKAEIMEQNAICKA